jgi:hypothetical protein
MAKVSLRDSNEDIIRLVAGESPRAKAIVADMMDVAEESQRKSGSRAFFSYMMLCALKESDITPERLVTLHEKVCHSNPSLTAAMAVNAFATRSPHLAESVRKAELGLTDHYDPAAILDRLNQQYGYFGRKEPVAAPASSPARAMAEITSPVEEKITVAPGGVTNEWALAIQPGSPAKPSPRSEGAEMGPPATWQRVPARGEQHAHA